MGSAKSPMLILILIMVIASFATAMDMSVVSYDDNHHVTAGPGHEMTARPGRGNSAFDEASLIFESWMVKHGKVYDSVAEKRRRLTSMNACFLFFCEGSCWAFSTVGAVEGLNKIVTGELVTLSEQDLINCNKDNNGCRGGKIETAYEFIVNNGGLGTDNDYPYKAVNGICDGRLKENNKNVMIDGYENLHANDELALRKAVAHQPVTAVIDSSSREFQLYESFLMEHAEQT